VRDAALKIEERFSVPTSSSGVGERSDTQPADDSKGEAAVNKPLTFTLKSLDHSPPYLESRE
jgi:hypothetical protein